MVVGPVDPLLAVAANEVQPAAELGSPGHLAAWERQRRPLDPAAGVRRPGGGRVEHALLVRDLRQRDAAGLTQGLVGGVVLVAGLGDSRDGEGGEAPGEKGAAGRHQTISGRFSGGV
jgi:hypothetical protein